MSNSKLSKCSLSDFPEELLCGILNEVGSGIDEEYVPGTMQTLLALSATSRQFNRLTESYLYKTIKTDHFHCRKLVQRLEDDPTLVSHIKRVIWDKKPSETPEWYRTLPNTISAPNLARKFNISKIPLFWVSGDWRDKCAALTLVLLLTPRLEALEIMDTDLRFRMSDGAYGSSFWPTLWRNPDRGLIERFANIRTLRFGHQDMDLEALFCVLQLPSLRTLSFKGELVDKDIYKYGVVRPMNPSLARYAQLARMPPRSSPIEYLHIENSAIHSKHVAMILRCIKNLKDFSLTFTGTRTDPLAISRAIYEHNGYGVPALHYPALNGAIMEHSNSLESLTLQTNLSHEPNIYNTAAAGCLRLQQVRNLKYLRTDIVTLYRDETTNPDRQQHEIFNSLPPGIRRLDLDMYEPTWPYFRCPKAALMSLAMDCAQKYPLLKDVRVLRHTTHESKLWGAFSKVCKEVENAFEVQGVTIRFCPRTKQASSSGDMYTPLER
ncbi:hypothetical protein J4E93_004912 [Alternaria ventricosa]|uniref:uncharacterized protein n=1 Tax=Alternaria ventricosa TaxID=1187951 RepID=UPI0020C55C21|nr:uncharacterized protein J4E93_004912 [Alternaria ventricosa]KAI4646689.1 hypothetical protein J4E93_004912 [Alternaria ventricosa]